MTMHRDFGVLRDGISELTSQQWHVMMRCVPFVFPSYSKLWTYPLEECLFSLADPPRGKRGLLTPWFNLRPTDSRCLPLWFLLLFPKRRLTKCLKEGTMFPCGKIYE